MSTTPIPPGSGTQPAIPVDDTEEKSQESLNKPEYTKQTTGGPSAGKMSIKERMAQNKIRSVTPQNNVTPQTGNSSDEPRSTRDSE
ncbi:hypothetical protein [Endozoicomonas arenosclerae]|uniref:hypothetical protein n=1 Tax=Endozoicomonas arenosclerae TaxID=1633495 RepID=UPI0007863B49|nr:hypothetical protein [Endozoicomonas arenosclerae]